MSRRPAAWGQPSARARAHLQTHGVITPHALRGAYQPCRVLARLEGQGMCQRVRPLPLWAAPVLASALAHVLKAGSTRLSPPPEGATVTSEARRVLAARGVVAADDLAPLDQGEQRWRAMARLARAGECVEVFPRVWATPLLAARIRAAIAAYQTTAAQATEARSAA